MRLAEPGDVVFSFYDQHIQHLGIVQSRAVTAPKPTEFATAGHYWSEEGWLVPVQWRVLPSPYRPKDIISVLRPLLPPKYSPLQQSGDGLQSVYLAAVPEPMARVLLDQAPGFSSEVLSAARTSGDDDGAVRTVDDAIEKVIQNDTSIDATERTAVIAARRGQGKFRANLEQIESRCRVSGITEQRLLRASHVKPWRSCTNNHERLDGYNGLLLAPHIDHLFDRGYISFEDDGAIMISLRIPSSQFKLLGIDPEAPPQVGAFRPELHTSRPTVQMYSANLWLRTGAKCNWDNDQAIKGCHVAWGPSRHFACLQQSGRSHVKADIGLPR
jgi:putative restriction endonuclease